MDKRELKERMKSLLLFLPNLVRLCGSLLRDRRVPRTEKVLLGAALLYAIAPLDFLPDMIPFVGQIDDAYLIGLTLLRLIDRTDQSIVREHWRGNGDIVRLAQSLSQVAPMLLPKRVARILRSRIESKSLQGASKFMVEVPEERVRQEERTH